MKVGARDFGVTWHRPGVTKTSQGERRHVEDFEALNAEVSL